jgi:hypothetical protein
MADAFLSYSRINEEFAALLEAALLATDPPHTVWRDKSGLGPGVKWRPEVQEGIATADNFIFIITPESVRDTISDQLPPGVAQRPCGFEIDHAVSLGKRIVPVLLEDAPSETVHPAVRECNYVDFRDPAGFGASFERLLTALHTDTEWVHAHTRLQNRASDWVAQSRDRSYLLSGNDLTGAERWLAQPAETHQGLKPTDLEREYIAASRLAETTSQRRRTRIAYVFGGAMACLAVYSVYQRVAAERATQHLATEVVRYSWVDIAHRQEEDQLLKDVAKTLHKDAEELLPQDADGFTGVHRESCNTYLSEGFRYLYCSLRDVIGLRRLQAISGRRVFLPGGPHDEEFDFHSKRSFGRYNPLFLFWLERYMVPSPSGDARTNELIRMAYATQIGPAARALYHTHQVLFASPEGAEEFRRRYEAAKTHYVLRPGGMGYYEFPGRVERVELPIEAARAEYRESVAAGAPLDLGERFRWLSDYEADVEKDDWYLANTSAGFWIRRSIDGTEPEVFRLVTKLLQAYDPGVLAGAEAASGNQR